MMKRENPFSIIIVFFLLIVGCSSNEDLIKKAIQKLDYDVLVPSYIPLELELTDVILDGDLLILTYANADNTSYIEIIQRQYARSSLNIEGLLEFTENGKDPYEKIPPLSYVKIDNFVGEYQVNDKLDNIIYHFIPAVSKTKFKSYPHYWVNSVGIDDEEFQKVIKSLP